MHWRVRACRCHGDGQQIRDWFVRRDHCSAIRRVLGQVPWVKPTTWAVGMKANPRNCAHHLQATRRTAPARRRQTVQRPDYFRCRPPGHDRRYAIDARKLERELGWKPAESFETGIAKTVRWYLDNQAWVANVQSGAYRDWVAKQYGAEGTAA